MHENFIVFLILSILSISVNFFLGILNLRFCKGLTFTKD
jgi:hypothetical protein